MESVKSRTEKTVYLSLLWPGSGLLSVASLSIALHALQDKQSNETTNKPETNKKKEGYFIFAALKRKGWSEGKTTKQAEFQGFTLQRLCSGGEGPAEMVTSTGALCVCTQNNWGRNAKVFAYELSYTSLCIMINRSRNKSFYRIKCTLVYRHMSTF